ncbi:serine/threonine-protein kinase [Streptomyces sp. NPDC002671]
MARDQLLGGRYRLVRELGKGGMGQVWEARDERLGRPVAVKVISLLAGGGSRGDEARARFRREAEITARLQHPNIVTVHDLGETGPEDDRAPFLVMELVRGEGLDEVLRGGAVGLPDAAGWAAQICDALADAHGAGILHRDIKPSNILITSSGVVKVLDFGIARAADPYATTDRLTRTGFIVGTPPYMAPEQARGFPEPRSDLYALGCLLFELITGRLPFEGPDTMGYLSAHLTQEPPKPSSVSTGIPPVWDDLLLALLRKDPDKRYPNAVDLARALRQLDHATPESVPPSDGPGTIPGLPPRRSAATTATAGTALACLLTASAIPVATNMTSGSRTVQMTLFGALAVVYAIGVVRLLARNTAGRWLVATGGIGLALQAVQAMPLLNTGNTIGAILQGVLPVTAVTAALSALLAGFSAAEPRSFAPGRPRRRHAWLIAGTTIVAVLVVWGIGYVWSTTW